MRKRLLQLGTLGFGVAPLVFGVMRATSPARDLRMLWMAAASGLGTAVVLTLLRSRIRTGSLVRQSTIVLVVATLLAAGTAYLLGAAAWFGVWAVALVLAGCWTAATACGALLRATPGGSPR
jgi:hypothetical protein